MLRFIHELSCSVVWLLFVVVACVEPKGLENVKCVCFGANSENASFFRE